MVNAGDLRGEEIPSSITMYTLFFWRNPNMVCPSKVAGALLCNCDGPGKMLPARCQAVISGVGGFQGSLNGQEQRKGQAARSDYHSAFSPSDRSVASPQLPPGQEVDQEPRHGPATPSIISSSTANVSLTVLAVEGLTDSKGHAHVEGPLPSRRLTERIATLITDVWWVRCGG
jgi:hypothetical protein